MAESLLKNLNKVGMCAYPETIKLSELEIGLPYPIKSARRLTSFKWATVLLELENGNHVYLPSRVASIITDKEIQHLPLMALIPKGSKDVGKEQPAQLVEFIKKLIQ